MIIEGANSNLVENFKKGFANPLLYILPSILFFKMKFQIQNDIISNYPY